MLLAALALAAAAPAAPPSKTQVASVSVEIIAAEEIRFEEQQKPERGNRQQIRQHRTRGGMPLVEFY